MTRHRIGRPVLAVVSAALLVLSSVVEAVAERGVHPAAVAPTVGPTLAVVVVGVLLTPWSAAVGVVTAVLAYPLQILVDDPGHGIGGSLLVAMMLLVGQGAARLPTAASALGAVGAALAGSGFIVAQGESAFEFLFFSVTMGGAWAVGWLLRRERTRTRELRALAAALAAERERSGRLAVAEERTRISRELHDAVAHTVSVMTLQVGVVRRRLGDSPEGTVLHTVEELGRRSVDELRRVVGALRADAGGPGGDADGPAPSVRDLEGLCTQLRGVGLDVAVHTVGDPVDLAPAMDASAYRIVAEALTNVLKHAGTDTAEVVLTHRPDEMEIEIRDRGLGGVPAVPESGAGGGHGLVTLRERATLFGGRPDAGPREGGGFRVRAVLPLGPPVRAPAPGPAAAGSDAPGTHAPGSDAPGSDASGSGAGPGTDRAGTDRLTGAEP